MSAESSSHDAGIDCILVGMGNRPPNFITSGKENGHDKTFESWKKFDR